MPNEVAHRFPWEPVPEPSTADLVASLRRDFAIAVRLTAIVVHSSNPDFCMTVNAQRGQLIPRNEVKFSDGTTVELQDIGMCQPGNVPYMTVPEILARILELAGERGLTIAK